MPPTLTRTYSTGRGMFGSLPLPSLTTTTRKTMQRTLRAPRVFIPHKAHHDYSAAKQFGELVFIVEGSINRFDVSRIAFLCSEVLKDAEAGDYLMISSLSVINSVAAAMFGARFGRLNLLLHDSNTGAYHSRSIIIKEGT